MNIIKRYGKTDGLLTLLLATVLLVSGCGKKEKKAGTVTLTFTHGTGAEQIAVFKKIVQSFETKYPTIKIKRMDFGGGYYPKVMAMIAGDSSPDVMWMGQSFAEFADRGCFLDLTDRIEKEIDINRYYKRVVGWYRYKGRYYGFPCSIDMNILFYNKNLFDEAGILYPTEKWTSNEFLEAAQKLTRTGEKGRVSQWGYIGDVTLGWFGASYFNQDNTKCMLDQPEAIECLRFKIDLVKKYKVSPMIGEGDLVSGMAMDKLMAFKMGKAGMYLGATWNLLEFRNSIKAFEWDICLNPVFKKRSHWASSGGYAISRDTRHPEEAWTFFKFLISPEAQRIGAVNTLPVCKDIAMEVVKNHTGPPENIKAFYDAIPYLQPYPRINNLGEIISITSQEIELAMLGQQSPEEAFKQATKKVDAILSAK